jgi:hypothetical protein
VELGRLQRSISDRIELERWKGSDLPAFGIFWPGVTSCEPIVSPRTLELLVLTSDKAVSMLLFFAGIVGVGLRLVIKVDTGDEVVCS